jgi:hypothetical protein
MPVINGVQYAPLANASAVLPDGRVIVMGGEYNWLGNKYSNGEPVWTSLGAIYDPVANTWTPVSAPAGAGWTGTTAWVAASAMLKAPCWPTAHSCSPPVAAVRMSMRCLMPRT